jgi:hypothetical protein
MVSSGPEDIARWSDPPDMDHHAPRPWVERDGDNLLLAYRTRREGHFAVLRFAGLLSYAFDPWPDPAHHPHLAKLEPGRFHQVRSPGLEATGFQRWIVTFPGEALDVTALAADIVVRAVHALDSAHAIAALRA